MTCTYFSLVIAHDSCHVLLQNGFQDACVHARLQQAIRQVSSQQPLAPERSLVRRQLRQRRKLISGLTAPVASCDASTGPAAQNGPARAHTAQHLHNHIASLILLFCQMHSQNNMAA